MPPRSFIVFFALFTLCVSEYTLVDVEVSPTGLPLLAEEDAEVAYAGGFRGRLSTVVPPPAATRRDTRQSRRDTPAASPDGAAFTSLSPPSFIDMGRVTFQKKVR